MEQQTIKTPKNVGALQPKAAGAVAKKKGSSVVEYLNDAKFQAQIAAALPKFLDTEHFVRSALTEFRLNPALAECSVPSVLGYFMQAAACGLEPASVLGQCYPVPFNNKKTGQKECQFILGYRGMLAIARRSGEVSSVSAQIVHENDTFDIVYGLESKLEHKPCVKGNPGAMVGAYVVVRFKDKEMEPQIMYMSKDDIEKHRKRSKAADSGPWMKDYEEMSKKTVFRSVFKWLPVSIEQAVEASNDGTVARYNANAINADDALEIEFVAAEDDAGEAVEEAPVSVDEAVEKMAEQMKV